MIEIKLSYAADRATAVKDCRFWAPLALPAEAKQGVEDPARARAPGRRARRRAGRVALHLHGRSRRGGRAHRAVPRAGLPPPRVPQPGGRPARIPRALRRRDRTAPARRSDGARSGVPGDRGYDPARAAPPAHRRRDSALWPGVRRRAARCAGRRGRGRRLAVDVGSLLPERRRGGSGRAELRVHDDPRGARRRDHPREPRRARGVQLVPQRRPARRHGAHDRPRRAAAASCSASGPAGSSRTTSSTATRSAVRATASTRSRRRSRGCATASRRLSPQPVRGRLPLLDRRRRRAHPAAPRRGVRRPLELLRHARRDGAQERHPRRALREHRARPGRDRAYGAARGRRGGPLPTATTRLA